MSTGCPSSADGAGTPARVSGGGSTTGTWHGSSGNLGTESPAYQASLRAGGFLAPGGSQRADGRWDARERAMRQVACAAGGPAPDYYAPRPAPLFRASGAAPPCPQKMLFDGISDWVVIFFAVVFTLLFIYLFIWG